MGCMVGIVVVGTTVGVAVGVMVGTVVANRGEAKASKKANNPNLDKSISARVAWFWFFVVYFFGGLPTLAIVGWFGYLASSNPYDGFSLGILGGVGFIVGAALVFLVNPFVARMFAKAYGLGVESSPPPPVDVF